MTDQAPINAAGPFDPTLSLFQLLDPAVHADPYPFYKRLREEAPVMWDPFMHTWVVTRCCTFFRPTVRRTRRRWRHWACRSWGRSLT